MATRTLKGDNCAKAYFVRQVSQECTVRYSSVRTMGVRQWLWSCLVCVYSMPNRDASQRHNQAGMESFPYANGSTVVGGCLQCIMNTAAATRALCAWHAKRVQRVPLVVLDSARRTLTKSLVAPPS